MAVEMELSRVLLAWRRQELASWTQALEEARLRLGAIRQELVNLAGELDSCQSDEKSSRQWQRVRLLSALVEAKSEVFRCQESREAARTLCEGLQREVENPVSAAERQFSSAD